MVHALDRAGFDAVVMHFRGCSGEPNSVARSYHAGAFDDLDEVIRHISRTRPVFAAVGYSLGGNVLINWLARSKDPGSLIKTAVGVSVPYQLDVAARRMDQGFSKVYQRRLIGLMRKKLLHRFETVDCPIDLSELEQWTSFRRFDHHVTAPLHGFDSVDHYYKSVSSRQFVDRIGLPTLLLHALDDPFMEPGISPNEAELSPFTRLEVSTHGGHVGFLGQRGYWLEQRVPGHLRRMHDSLLSG